MENIKQKIVLPTRGVCNTTPDPICEDNELEDCVGFSYSDEAVRPIQDVKPLLSIGEGTLMYVHRLNDGETVNYISTTGTDIRWGDDGCVEIGFAVRSVKCVGNTLLVNTDNGLYYLLWYNGTYKNIGNKITEPELYFDMQTSGVMEESYHPPFGLNDYLSNGCDVENLYSTDGAAIKVQKKNIDAFYDGVAAAYAKNKNDVAEKKMFHSPFFVCYAFEMYDGTYSMASNPILMLPSTTRSSYFMKVPDNPLICVTHFARLVYWLLYDFTPWKDIIKNITIFASPQIEQLDIKPNYDTTISEHVFISASNRFEGIIEGKFYGFDISHLQNTRYIYRDVLPERERSEVLRDLVDMGLFYKIAEIKDANTDPLHTSWEFVPILEKSVLRNLTTQPRLEPLEFYSHCSFAATGIETFNRRLNMYGVSRTFFEGFKSFMPLGGDPELSRGFLFKWFYTVEVTILINGEENIVRYSFNTIDAFCSQMWYYYPDPRAKHVKITNRNGRIILDVDLTEHKRLNGAYYFSDFISSTYIEVRGEGEESLTLPAPENLNNYLLQSPVDMPFMFSASGYVRVGQGKILGLAALTTALSQDAYKVATTIAFTTQGIWGLEIDGEGVYKTVPPPFSREVCSNPKSITMVDNGIYYVSKRGLMVISDNANGCVTTQICGKNHKEYDSFTEFIQNCTCAYDYRDSQLWLINPDYDFHWVYSIKSGTLSRKKDGHSYEAVVSDYPDTLLQAEGSLFSMYQEPNINDDETLYSGFFITRPMKFEQAMALKSLRDLKHIKDVSPEAEIVLTIYASNDCASWQQLSSLKGRGFKYFKFRYDLTNLKAADAFCGTVLYYTTRLTDRIR